MSKEILSKEEKEFRYGYGEYKAQVRGSKMARLQEQVEFFSKKIEQENLKMAQINNQIARLEQELEAKRNEQASRSKQRDHDPVALARKNKALQMKLDGIRQKQNNLEAENKGLRELINNLRREKNLFKNIYGKLKDELNNKKDDLRRVISESNFAKQYINQAQEELRDQQKQAFAEQRKFEKDYTVHIEDKSKPTPTERVVSGVGTFRDQMTSPTNKLSQNVSIFHDTEVNIVSNRNMPLKQLIQDRKERIKEEEKQLKLIQAQVKEYEQIIQDLYVQTGSQSMEEVISTFREHEEENFILFRNVNQLDDEYETLLRQKKKLLEELEQLKSMPKENMQDTKALKMQSALSQIQEAKRKKEVLQQKYNQQHQIWEQIKGQLPVMYSKLTQLYASMGHDDAEVFNDEINMNNAIKFLSMMERLTTSILSQHTMISSSRTLERRNTRVYEESNFSNNGQAVSPANEDFDKALDKLEEEFHNNIEKLQEDRERRQTQKEQDPREKLLSREELREIAEKDFKKYVKRPAQRKHTVQK